MKKLKTGLTSLLLLILTGAIGIAQEASSSQAFWIHEDVVKPSKAADYEAICKELTDNLRKHNIQEFSSIVTNTEDDRYLWVSPIANMADIDKPIFKTLMERDDSKCSRTTFQTLGSPVSSSFRIRDRQHCSEVSSNGAEL